MKAMLYLAALVPLSVMAQPINIDNNPNQPGYVVPSQQRMQNQMQTQQMQQQNTLETGYSEPVAHAAAASSDAVE